MERWHRIQQVLDIVASCGKKGAGVADLMRELELPKATAYRMMYGLQEIGVVVFNQVTGRYHIGTKVLEWASAYLSQSSLVEALQETVSYVTAEVQLFSYAAWLQDDHLVCLATAQPRSVYPVYVKLGSRLPLRASAAAKTLLAPMTVETVSRLLDRDETDAQLWAPTPFTLSVREFIEDLAIVRKQGWAVCRDELEVGNSAIAVRIGMRVSVAVVGPTPVIGARESAIIRTLRHAASKVEPSVFLIGQVGG